MTQPCEPVRLSPSQRERATEVLVRAFSEDVVYRYLFPEPRQRDRALRRYFGTFLSYSLLYGDVYTTPDVRGVACWLSPWVSTPRLWRLVRTGFAMQRAMMSYSKETRKNMMDLIRFNGEVMKRVCNGPLWHLAILGVDPDYQRRGIGGRLIQPVLAKSDLDGVPCYLETETEGNVRFYEKHGFRVVNDGVVPGHSVRIWAMLRQSRRQPSPEGS